MACCNGCLDKQTAPPAYPVPTTRHLLYHVYPVSGNGMWQWNVDELVKRIALFNGRRVVAVAIDPPKGRESDYRGKDAPDNYRDIPGCDSFGAVMERFGPHAKDIEFVRVQNDPKLREVATFLPLFDRLSSRVSPGECFLYAQAKGVSRPLGHIAKRWTEALLETLLDYWPVVSNSLTQHPVTGSFKKKGRGWPRTQSDSNWHYSGSWFWCRNRELFTKLDWRKIDQFWSGIEPYPSQHFGRESGCVFHESSVAAMNLYNASYWARKVEPDLDRFRLAHCNDTTAKSGVTVVHQILDFIRRTRAALSLPAGRVLEVGSRDVNGTPRSAFPDASGYVGVDMEPGPGVDLVCNGERLSDQFPPDSFDSVVCCEVLEHCVRPWVVVEGMRKVLRPGGLLWVTTPTFGLPEHRYPIDCYRFGEDAYRRWLFDGMEILKLENLINDDGYPIIAAVGRKP